MNWKCERNSLLNIIKMIGEIDDSPVSINVMMLRASLYIEIGIKNQGTFVVSNDPKINYPPSYPGKLTVSFQMIFPNDEAINNFYKDLDTFGGGIKRDFL